MGVDESHTLGAQGGHRSIDIGQDTDLATALYINDNGTIHATWHSDYHSSAVIKTDIALETRDPINWSFHSTHGGTKVAGILPIEPPYVSVCYWRRVA